MRHLLKAFVLGWALWGWNGLDASRLRGAEDSLPSQVKGLYKGVREHKLSNGLRVVLLPMRASSTVTMMVTYKVGACDEDKTATGLSHYLEHLMFKGTPRYPAGAFSRVPPRTPAPPPPGLPARCPPT